MEDKFLVAKTLLACYRHLDDLYDALTESAESCVRSGFYAIFPKEQMSIYERIMRYEERKTGLYNMKYLVEECFRRESSPSLSLLKEKYIRNLSMNDIMEKYGVSMRTCYRHLKKGLISFTHGLEKFGYDKTRLLFLFGNEPLFQTMLARVIREDDAENRSEGAAAGKGEKINNRRNPLPRGNSDHGCCYF